MRRVGCCRRCTLRPRRATALSRQRKPRNVRGSGSGDRSARARRPSAPRHSGAVHSTEPGISRFQVWFFGPSRNDGERELLLVLIPVFPVLVLFLVLLLFLAALARAILIEPVAVIGEILVLEHLHRLALSRFLRGALGGLLLALLAIVLIGVEDQMQPRHHLLDRRQLAGRPRFAARAGGALRPLFALRPWFAARTLRPRLAKWPCLALRSRLATRAIGAALAGMTLRAGTPRRALLAARTGRSLWSSPGGRFIRHALLLHAPIQEGLLSRRLLCPAIAAPDPADLININRRRLRNGIKFQRSYARRSEPMGAGWKIVWLAVAAGVIAFVAARVLVPDVVPVGYAEEAQASWAVLTAFVLRAIELTSLWVAAIALCVLLGARLRRIISSDSRRRPSRSSR